MKAKTFYK